MDFYNQAVQITYEVTVLLRIFSTIKLLFFRVMRQIIVFYTDIWFMDTISILLRLQHFWFVFVKQIHNRQNI